MLFDDGPIALLYPEKSITTVSKAQTEDAVMASMMFFDKYGLPAKWQMLLMRY